MALDTSLLEDLSLDELRWLEASEILEFPASPTHSVAFNDSVIHPFSNCRQWSEPRSKQFTRSTKRLERLYHNPPSQPISTSLQETSSSSIARTSPWTSSLPTPPSTPTKTPSMYAPRMALSESPTTTQPWLHRQPRAITPKGSPTPSLLSSSLPINHQFSSTSNKSALSRTSSVASNVATPTAMKIPVPGIVGYEEDGDRKSPGSRSAKDPFWTALRPRSRSLRSVPTLKTIPSQSEVNLRTPSLIVEEDDRESSLSDINAIHPLGGTTNQGAENRRTLSTESSASSTSSQSDVPSTPSDPYSAFLKSAQAQTRSFYDRRHTSKSSSFPSKSIFARTPSASTAKESPTITAAHKSVKFAEMPTVHYGSGRARDSDPPAEGPSATGPIDKVDSQTGLYVDLPDIIRSRPTKRVARLERISPAVRPAELDVPTPSVAENELVEGKEASALKRFIPFARRPSASRSPHPTNRTAALTSSSGSNTPSSAPIPIPPPLTNSGRPSISGPYPLGSFVPSSPTHSTSSLRSNMSKSSRKSTTRSKSSSTNGKTPRAFFSFTSSSTTPTSSISHLYGTGTSSLEDYRKNRSEATKSVRSLASVKSSTSATTGLKSWLSRFGR